MNKERVISALQAKCADWIETQGTYYEEAIFPHDAYRGCALGKLVHVHPDAQKLRKEYYAFAIYAEDPNFFRPYFENFFKEEYGLSKQEVRFIESSFEFGSQSCAQIALLIEQDMLPLK